MARKPPKKKPGVKYSRNPPKVPRAETNWNGQTITLSVRWAPFGLQVVYKPPGSASYHGLTKEMLNDPNIRKAREKVLSQYDPNL